MVFMSLGSYSGVLIREVSFMRDSTISSYLFHLFRYFQKTNAIRNYYKLQREKINAPYTNL